jgi:hypothetical protein
MMPQPVQGMNLRIEHRRAGELKPHCILLCYVCVGCFTALRGTTVLPRPLGTRQNDGRGLHFSNYPTGQAELGFKSDSSSVDLLVRDCLRG